MSPPVSLALCGLSPVSADRLRAWLEEHPAMGMQVAYAVPDTDGLLERLADEPVHGIVLDAGLGMEGLSFAQELQAAGYMALCIAGRQEAPHLRRRAAELGIALCPDAEPSRVAAILRQLLGLAAGTAAEGRIITFHSPRGGAGTSTLLLHLARSLTSRGYPVAVVEVSGSGGMVPLLGLRPGGGWAELLPYPPEEVAGHPDGPSLVARAMVEVDRGLHLLPSSGPALMDELRVELVEAVLQLLGACGYAYILVDTPSEMTVLTGAALAVADSVCLIGLPEVVSAYRLVQVEAVLNDLRVPADRVYPVLNRTREPLPQRVGEVLQFLPYRPALRVPEEARPTVDGAGIFGGFRPGGGVARALDRLLDDLVLEVSGS